MRKNLRQSYRKCQDFKDKTAFENTVAVIKDRYKTMNKQNTKWIPKTINDENSLFSSKVPSKKAFRKPGEAAKISINIFDMQSSFKPCLKRNQLSVRSSKIFSENQEQANWRSCNKKSDFIPYSGESSAKKCFKAAIDHPAKRSSIDLSWGQEMTSNSRLKQSITFGKQANPIVNNDYKNNQQKMFQQKKRTNFSHNYSSIQF